MFDPASGADRVFQTGCFAPGSAAVFSTTGALRAPVFYRFGGKSQATRYAGDR